MNAVLAVTFCLLVILEPVNCRDQRKLQPWMQGTIAVVVFLVLTGIAFVVNRLWCQDKEDSLGGKNTEPSMGGHKEELVISNGTEGQYSVIADNFRCKEGRHVYENPVEADCRSTTESHDQNTIKVLTTCM
ncbi:PDZK1-interacting protein 1 [Hemicordylus capensis]|uniref:PDZK1-interacting protein 1 n=1 Tax=Hemicordylus capensis TaxID=884348 RepID=UPI0023036289|nr:PDZK1-interacting protein 1 [Hemicordylus capensis]